MSFTLTTFNPLTNPPEDQLLAAMEELVRKGIPELTGGTEWTAATAPAEHWLCPVGTRIFRYDVPDKAKAPCVLLSYWKDSAPRNHHDDTNWILYPMGELFWPRDLTDLETQQLRTMLQSVLTSDLGAPVPAA